MHEDTHGHWDAIHIPQGTSIAVLPGETAPFPPLPAGLHVVGTSVFLRLSSFIALCIGVQIIWNGMSTLLKSLLKG